MSTESCFSPLRFILKQLEAAEAARLQESIEPPKRPRGRPPKVEEPPLQPGAYRHVLSDEDSAFDKQLLKDERASTKHVEPELTILPTTGSLAIIVPNADKYTCLIEGETIGTSKHKDYWEYHYARGDLRITQGKAISKFVRMTTNGDVESVASAQHLKEHGTKGSMLSPAMLTDAERAVLAEAFEYSRG